MGSGEGVKTSDEARRALTRDACLAMLVGTDLVKTAKIAHKIAHTGDQRRSGKEDIPDEEVVERRGLEPRTLCLQSRNEVFQSYPRTSTNALQSPISFYISPLSSTSSHTVGCNLAV